MPLHTNLRGHLKDIGLFPTGSKSLVAESMFAMLILAV